MQGLSQTGYERKAVIYDHISHHGLCRRHNGVFFGHDHYCVGVLQSHCDGLEFPTGAQHAFLGKTESILTTTKGKGHFAQNNNNLWVLTSGQGTTFDKHGNSVYTGNFVKQESGDVILKNGCYKSFEGGTLVKSVR